MRTGVDRFILVGAIVGHASGFGAGGAALPNPHGERMAAAADSPLAVQREDSLIARARANGGSAGAVISTDGPVSTVEQIVEPSSLIVRGVVRSATAKLSPDETQVVTEYELVPLRLYKGSLPPLDRPGMQPPIRFTIPCGTLDVDGLHLWTTVNIFPAAEMPRPGEELVVFLSWSPHWQTLALWGGAFAAFRVVDGQVVGLTKEARERRRDTPETITQFEQRLGEALAKSLQLSGARSRSPENPTWQMIRSRSPARDSSGGPRALGP